MTHRTNRRCHLPQVFGGIRISGTEVQLVQQVVDSILRFRVQRRLLLLLASAVSMDQ